MVNAMQDLDLTHPALSDLRARAKRRMPHFAFEYLDSATGRELGAKRNRDRLDAVQFMPAILRGGITPDLSTQFMGQTHDLPVGIAPLGMSGMIWPGAERLLAKASVRHSIPYCQSSVTTKTPEDTSPFIGDRGWFQHYPVNDADIRRDMLKRIRDAGFSKLVMTVDVPAESRRERQRRAHISMPPKLTPKIILSMLLHPHWSLAMAKEGAPRMPFPESYVDASRKDAFVHAGRVIRGWPDWAYLDAVREEWKGDFVVKGVLEPDDAVALINRGVDGIWVSNHTGRQFEGGPAAIDQLPKVRNAVGPDVPLIFDSGVEGGLDMMRALAYGADFVFMGRAFHYAVAAFGARGIDHWISVLKADMSSNMAQIGAATFAELANRLIPLE